MPGMASWCPGQLRRWLQQANSKLCDIETALARVSEEPLPASSRAAKQDRLHTRALQLDTMVSSHKHQLTLNTQRPPGRNERCNCDEPSCAWREPPVPPDGQSMRISELVPGDGGLGRSSLELQAEIEAKNEQLSALAQRMMREDSPDEWEALERRVAELDDEIAGLQGLYRKAAGAEKAEGQPGDSQNRPDCGSRTVLGTSGSQPGQGEPAQSPKSANGRLQSRPLPQQPGEAADGAVHTQDSPPSALLLAGRMPERRSGEKIENAVRPASVEAGLEERPVGIGRLGGELEPNGEYIRQPKVSAEVAKTLLGKAQQASKQEATDRAVSAAFERASTPGREEAGGQRSSREEAAAAKPEIEADSRESQDKIKRLMRPAEISRPTSSLQQPGHNGRAATAPVSHKTTGADDMAVQVRAVQEGLGAEQHSTTRDRSPLERKALHRQRAQERILQLEVSSVSPVTVPNLVSIPGRSEAGGPARLSALDQSGQQRRIGEEAGDGLRAAQERRLYAQQEAARLKAQLETAAMLRAAVDEEAARVKTAKVKAAEEEAARLALKAAEEEAAEEAARLALKAAEEEAARLKAAEEEAARLALMAAEEEAARVKTAKVKAAGEAARLALKAAEEEAARLKAAEEETIVYDNCKMAGTKLMRRCAARLMWSGKRSLLRIWRAQVTTAASRARGLQMLQRHSGRVLAVRMAEALQYWHVAMGTELEETMRGCFEEEAKSFEDDLEGIKQKAEAEAAQIRQSAEDEAALITEMINEAAALTNLTAEEDERCFSSGAKAEQEAAQGWRRAESEAIRKSAEEEVVMRIKTDATEKMNLAWARTERWLTREMERCEDAKQKADQALRQFDSAWSGTPPVSASEERRNGWFLGHQWNTKQVDSTVTHTLQLVKDNRQPGAELRSEPCECCGLAAGRAAAVDRFKKELERGDVHDEASKIRAKAQEEAAQVLDQAKREAEEIKEKARRDSHSFFTRMQKGQRRP